MDEAGYEVRTVAAIPPIPPQETPKPKIYPNPPQGNAPQIKKMTEEEQEKADEDQGTRKVYK